MFSSTAISGILQSSPDRASRRDDGQVKKASVRTTVKRSRSSHQADLVSQQDTEAALIMLYEQFRRPIHSYVFRLLGNQEDADDITQEVFVRACSSWDGLYEREHLSPWLYRIATNLCVDQLRRRKRVSWWPLSRLTRGHDAASDEESREDASLLLSDEGGIPEVAEREQIRLILSTLPEEYAIVLVLSAAQGVSYQEIATIVGISPQAAATRISRAKRMFTDAYQRLVPESKHKTGKEEKRS